MPPVRLPRWGLAARIAALATALVAVIVLAGIGAVALRVHQLQSVELIRALTDGRDRVDEAIGERLRRLELVDSLLANDPPFRAYVAEGHEESILDNLQERLPLYGCDRLIVANGAGVILADTLRLRAARSSLAEDPLLAPVLDGSVVRGLWRDARGGLFLAAAAPIAEAGTRIVGAIVALETLDDDLARELTRIAGGEVALFARDTEGSGVTPLGSSMRLARSGLAQWLASPQVDAARAIMGSPAPTAARLDLEGERHAALVAPLEDLTGKVAGGFVVLRPEDREVRALRGVEGTLAVTGAIALAIALITSVVVARRITRPVSRLAEAVARVREGVYDAPLPPGGHDEIGRLSEAFRAMVAELAEKEEMDTYLATLSRVAPSKPRASDVGGEATVTRIGSASRDLARHALPTGSVLAGRFDVLAPLGAGGMGIVYRAFDREINEVVAVKVLDARAIASDPERLQRFRDEIRLARRITHRNVVRTHDLAATDGTYLLTMECVEGIALADLLARGRLPSGAALRLSRQLLAGLIAAHSRGIAHADLKPSNLLLDAAGTLKIADFGLARLASATRVGDGILAGTPHYMSPEQTRGEPADLRSDVYAAGVLLFEMFTGRLPFEGSSLASVLAQHRDAPPPRPRDLEAGLAPALEAVILRALAKDPAQRYASAVEMADALESVHSLAER
ncbi:MAG TPA: protein kinase [Candidatus Polarisedimenticolaceae bacterium]|nr:protein kinase [Candidatus Polarisedimenticolaceae bacterium]